MMTSRVMRPVGLVALLTMLAVVAFSARAIADDNNNNNDDNNDHGGGGIQHLVVIFQENISFDHYFGSYPNALNPPGEPRFTAQSGTPTVNGLSGALLLNNPNLSNPQRLGRDQASTCDMGHGYTQEQLSYDHGLMDKFVETVGNNQLVSTCTSHDSGTAPNYAVMDYYDGNTVTALWNYAQHFAMSDNSYSTGFGPSTPGAFEVTAGNPFGATCGPTSSVFGTAPCPPGFGQYGPPVPQGTGTTYGDPDPYYDACGNQSSTSAMGGINVGDLLDARNVTWGWFQGGFRPTSHNPDGTPVCAASHPHTDQHGTVSNVTDYNAHHEPFMYYPQTSNPLHLPPTSTHNIGHSDQAHHQYDLADFWAAADGNNLPAVSYLKAPSYQDGHPGYSDPLNEQTFLVETINHLQRLHSWRSTAVVIAYDDSDGWYDHQMGPIVNQSQTPLDALSAPGQCGANPSKVPSGQQVRCGFGPRQPLLVVSPFARKNFVDNTLTDQSSVVRFVEDNWQLPRIGGGSVDALAGTLNGMLDLRHGDNSTLILDPNTGLPQHRE